MDSRIEELALIIAERAGAASENVQNAADGLRGDRYWSWKRLHSLAREMQAVIDDYRKAHPEEYEFTPDVQVIKLRGMMETYAAELVIARNELARYKEREKVQGWAPL